jgi:DNA-binding NtrC family response regulator
MRILIVDDEQRFASVLARALAAEGYSDVATAPSGEDALESLRDEGADLMVTDLRLPGMTGLELLGEAKRRWPALEVVLMTAFAEVATARDALKRGALDYLVKPFDNRELVSLVDQARSRRGSSSERDLPAVLAGMIGASDAMRRLFDELKRIARSEASVLILGESGTGKELAARAVHSLSSRGRGPFIEVHMAALPEAVIESELFGHERGAFTGADKRKSGLCELASGGTIFLDEIGEMPLHLQPKLLRFVQERRFYRVGGTEPVTVDARVVAATNRDLATEVKTGRFREDLFYRLDVASVTLPPLRERRADIPLLVRGFLKRADGAVTDAALAAMSSYDWPGNIRELANAVERARIVADGAAIDVGHLPPKVLGNPSTQRLTAVLSEDSTPMPQLDLNANERQLIEQALGRADGNKTRAAELLGITRRRLYSRMKLLGIAIGGEEDVG